MLSFFLSVSFLHPLFGFSSGGFIKLTLKKRPEREKLVHIGQHISCVSVKIWNMMGMRDLGGFLYVGNKL